MSFEWERRMKQRIVGLALILALVLACNYWLVPEVVITCGPSVVPTRLWPTPMPCP